MIPTAFPEQNCLFKAPDGLAESQCRSIPAFQTEVKGGSCDGIKVTIVAWQPTGEEIKALKNGAQVFLTMVGELAPHFLCTSFEQAIRPA